MAKKEESTTQPTTMKLWNNWCNTDPKFTKPFDNGSFKGTDINPTYRAMRLTEEVGPYGLGWGVQNVNYEYRETHIPGEVLLICLAELWWIDPETKERCVCGPHAGVDYLTKKTAKGDLRTDVEAHKKVLTDAMSSSWRFLGISSDVYMKLFDNSKYRDALDKEFGQDIQMGDIDTSKKADKPADKPATAPPAETPEQKLLAAYNGAREKKLKEMVAKGWPQDQAIATITRLTALLKESGTKGEALVKAVGDIEVTAPPKKTEEVPL
jgi:hypothetical protein